MRIDQNLIVFVTGGASGLGEAAVLKLHSMGAKLAVVDINEDVLKALETKLKERIICMKCDVTKEEEVKAAIDKTVAKYGTIHVVLPSAGVALVTQTLSKKGPLDMSVFDTVLKVNLYGSVHVAKYAAVVMANNKPMNDKGERGLILFVSSSLAHQGTKGMAAYAASKGAVSGIVLPMARDLGRYGIRVNAIEPGNFETSMTRANKMYVEKYMLMATPMGRAGQPDEFAHIVTTLIENSYLNGMLMAIDGAQISPNI